MSKKKIYAVLGLGIFGSTVAKTLSEFGFDVIAVDKEITNVDRVSEFVSEAVTADFTDIEQLRAIGIGDCDVAIVATGTRLEASIMAIMNLRELGVPYVLAKAKNKTYREILLKIGADKVVRPEKEMGERVAKQLLSQNVVDMIDIDDAYSIVEMHAPAKWQNKTLLELDLRKNYGINVLGVRKAQGTRLSISPGPDYKIEETDQLLVIAETTVFEKHEYLGKL